MPEPIGQDAIVSMQFMQTYERFAFQVGEICGMYLKNKPFSDFEPFNRLGVLLRLLKKEMESVSHFSRPPEPFLNKNPIEQKRYELQILFHEIYLKILEYNQYNEKNPEGSLMRVRILNDNIIDCLNKIDNAEENMKIW